VGARTLIAAGFVLVAACAGPDPAVTRVAVTPSPQAGDTRVVIELVNRSSGHGQVEVQIELREATTGAVVVAERMLELADHQRAELVVDVETPAGSYSASARVHYPD
jgi:hypothetical protein